jgi:hypothetical protein
VALLDGSFGDEFAARGGVEIVHDVGFEGRLVALERQQVIGLVSHDLVGDIDLAAHGIDGDQGAFELAGFGELVEKLGNSRNLIGLLRNPELRQGQSCGGRIGAERVQGLEPLAAVMGAACGLSIDGDELVPVRPESGDPAVEAALEQGRIDAVHQVAQPACAGDTVVELGETPEEVEMVFAPFDDVIEIIAGGDRRTNHQQ